MINGLVDHGDSFRIRNLSSEGTDERINPLFFIDHENGRRFCVSVAYVLARSFSVRRVKLPSILRIRTVSRNKERIKIGKSISCSGFVSFFETSCGASDVRISLVSIASLFLSFVFFDKGNNLFVVTCVSKHHAHESLSETPNSFSSGVLR